MSTPRRPHGRRNDTPVSERTLEYIRSAIRAKNCHTVPLQLCAGGGRGRTAVEKAIAALRRYRDVRGHSPETHRYDRFILRTIGKPPGEVTTADLEALLLRSRSVATRSTYHSRICSVFAALRDAGVIPEGHRPEAGLPKPRRPQHRPRPLSEAQVDELLAAPAPFCDIFRIALLTGARAMELCAMEGRDLTDGPTGPELLLHGKGGKEATVPAHPVVVDLITGYGTLGRLWPAWGSPKGFSAACNRVIRDRLGPGPTLHQLRHTFATRLLRATSDVVTVSQLMRHSSIQTTLIYAAVADDAKAQAILLLSG